jgi:hypothetical protein
VRKGVLSPSRAGKPRSCAVCGFLRGQFPRPRACLGMRSGAGP